MEGILKVLGVLWVLFILGLVIYYYKRILNFYRDLGAEVVSYLPFRASLKRGEKRIDLSLVYTLTLTIKIPLSGYLSLERGWFKRGFSLFSDDQRWAKIILESSLLNQLINLESHLPHLNSVEIVGSFLKFNFNYRGFNQNFQEEIKRALELMFQVEKSLMGLPSSTVGLEKERLRKWLIYYLPLGVFFLLSVVGMYWRVLGYEDALCRDDLLKLGFKILTPLFIFHLLVLVFLLGKHFHPKKNLLILFVLYFAGYYLIPLTILEPFNARFDQSEVKRIETVIKKKYILFGKMGGYFIELEGFTCSFQVSEKFYRKAKIKDRMVFYIKDGALGVPWAYRFWIED